MSSSDRRHPVPAQLFRHLPSSGSSANAEHSWLEHPGPTAHHPQRFATHDPSPQTMGLAGVFEFAKKQLAGGGKQIHSEHRRTSAGSPVPAMLSQSGMCERSELAANDSDGGRCRGSRMGGVSDGLHSTFSQRLVFISIPPSASVLFSSTSNPRPAPCFQCPQKN